MPIAEFDRVPGTCFRLPLVTIEMLPDNVLLEIFDFYRMADIQSLRGRPWRWHKLVHICQCWRQVIFASPLRLDLQLTCSYGTPVRRPSGCWPPLPLAIQYGGLPGRDPPAPEDDDNIIAAFQHPKRIWKIGLTLTNTLLKRLEPLVQEPFPNLFMTLHSSIHRLRVVISCAEPTPVFPHLDCVPTSIVLYGLCLPNSKGCVDSVAPRDWRGQVSRACAPSQPIGSSRLLR